MKYQLPITFYLIIFIFSFNQITHSQPLSFQFSAGLSTPNNEINNVYNSNTIQLENKLADVIRQSARLGYFFSFNVNLPLARNFVFNSGIGLHRFPQTTLNIIFPDQSFDTLILKSVQNIIPISVGLNWYIFKGILSPYLTGNLAYNYIVNSLDIVRMQTELPISTSKEYNRIGAGLGIGIDFNLEIITLSIEAKYHYLNLIGKTSEEANKSYLDLGISLIFGRR